MEIPETPETLETSEISPQLPQTPVPLDEYSYLETGGFSSERYKVEVRNLPKFYGISEFRKLLTTKLSLKPAKIKPPHFKSKWLYVCFHNDEERNRGIEGLNGFSWKGSKLICQIALPTPDPLVKKRKQVSEENESNKKVDMRSQVERLKDNAIPYWNIPYEEQIMLKSRSMRDVLLKLGNELWRINDNLKNYIENKRKIHNGLLCNLESVKTADKIEGYRNKCEFTISTDPETELPTVGFRLGTYTSGSTGVGPVADLCHISEEMKKIVVVFQEFVRSTQLKVYSPEDHSGHWKQLTVRQSNSDGHLMLIISIHTQDMTTDEINVLKDNLLKFIIIENSDIANVKSIYLVTLPIRKCGEPTSKIEHIYGETHIHDTIHGLRFRISPQAFFQINTNAAEILYQQAIELSQVLKESTVLDICCGTGTIGLCFSKHCDQVLGLELIPEAVTDAKANALCNDIKNADFFIGKAEDILTSVSSRAKHKDVIAIVDPPRSGLHMRAIVQLRRMKNIKKLVYISCDPNAAMKNFIDLGRMSSKTMHGDPFIPTSAVPVDMFPFTKHTELVLLFERVKDENVEMDVGGDIEECNTEVIQENDLCKENVDGVL